MVQVSSAQLSSPSSASSSAGTNADIAVAPARPPVAPAPRASADRALAPEVSTPKQPKLRASESSRSNGDSSAITIASPKAGTPGTPKRRGSIRFSIESNQDINDAVSAANAASPSSTIQRVSSVRLRSTVRSPSASSNLGAVSGASPMTPTASPAGLDTPSGGISRQSSFSIRRSFSAFQSTGRGSFTVAQSPESLERAQKSLTEDSADEHAAITAVDVDPVLSRQATWADIGDPSFSVVRNFQSTRPDVEEKHFSEKLGEFASTAICCNDLLSSVLFTTGLTSFYAGAFLSVCWSCMRIRSIPAIAAGFYAPLCLLLVSFVLMLFRHIYIELVTGA